MTRFMLIKKTSSFYLRFSMTLLVFTFLILGNAFAQTPLQTIRGIVVDIDAETPLVGTSVTIIDSDPIIGTSTDNVGKFRLENLPVGYYNLKISLIGYESIILSQILLESGKEVVLEIKLTEKTETLNEVILIGKRTDRTNISPLSIKTLTQEEVLRFPGTFYDPSRLVMTFAGVASADDQANNIAVRGNSPNGLAWRLEGLEIVNPNHLSNAGTFSDRPTRNGGGVNILSAQLLGTSNFLTSAFPAAYGNALSSVMDMRLRPGNNEQWEFTAQAGLIGFDVAAEGPIKKDSDVSFLINYRYSFIGLLTDLGVEVSDEDIRFQDLAFNLNIPYAQGGSFKIFGMGGISENIFQAQRNPEQWIFQKDRLDIFYDNRMAAIGISHSMPLGPKTIWSAALVSSNRSSTRIQDRVNDDLSQQEEAFDAFTETKNSLSTKINHRINAENKIELGIYITDSSDDFYSIYDSSQVNYDNLAQSIQVQPYLEYHKGFLSNRLQMNLGLHYHFHSFNGSQSVEPRSSFKYILDKKQQLSIAYGLHSQVQHPTLYFATPLTTFNESLGFTKAHHFVMAYQRSFNAATKLNAELYYQSLFDVPISANPNSSFSALNILEEPLFERLVSEGTGENYGIELSVQKTFSDNTFFLINGTYFDSKYVGSDGIKRDTRFNSQYIFNLTTGREFRWNKKGQQKVFGVNGRLAYYGGFRATPIDEAASILAGETIYVETEAFSLKQADFFKLDLRLYLKNNKAKYSSTISLDIQNATNRQNVAYNYFDTEKGEVVLKNQLGLIPILSYRVEF